MNVDVFQNPDSDCYLRVPGALFARDLTHDRVRSTLWTYGYVSMSTYLRKV